MAVLSSGGWESCRRAGLHRHRLITPRSSLRHLEWYPRRLRCAFGVLGCKPPAGRSRCQGRAGACLSERGAALHCADVRTERSVPCAWHTEPWMGTCAVARERAGSYVASTTVVATQEGKCHVQWIQMAGGPARYRQGFAGCDRLRWAVVDAHQLWRAHRRHLLKARRAGRALRRWARERLGRLSAVSGGTCSGGVRGNDNAVLLPGPTRVLHSGAGPNNLDEKAPSRTAKPVTAGRSLSAPAWSRSANLAAAGALPTDGNGLRRWAHNTDSGSGNDDHLASQPAAQIGGLGAAR